LQGQERGAEVINLDEIRRPGRLVPLAMAGAIGVSAALPLVQVAIIALGLVPQVKGGDRWLWAIVATCCYLPLHLRHVVYAVRGARPPGALWTLTAMAVVIFGALPLVGLGWLYALSSLAVSALLLLRPPLSPLIFASLVAAPLPLAAAFGSPQWGPYYALSVAWRSVPFALIWLAGAIRELDTTRQVLAGKAVEQERLRIDTELHRTLGCALEEIAERGAAAIASASQSAPRAARDLCELVAGARQTLAETRRMARGYQQPLLRSELDTAVALLKAAGIDVQILIRDHDLLDNADDTVKSQLRHAVAELLQADAAYSCAITVSAERGRIRLDIRSDRAGPAATEAAAG
jgi:signal transduction histidine kinase